MHIDDLCKIENINQEDIISILKKRYLQNNIYTYSGPILLSINPYNNLKLYNFSIQRAYHNCTEIDPHVYTIGERCYQDKTPQTIIISGESGSGKTENMKLLLDYFVNRTNTLESFNIKLKSLNILLECFGNAKTLLNDNSSRVGKMMSLYIRNGIERVEVQTYLLETSRVTHQSPGEGNFHVFYQLCKYKGIEILNDYIDNREVDGISNTTPILNSYTYNDIIQSLHTLNVQDTKMIEDTLLTILYLGYIKFTDNPLNIIECSYIEDINKVLEINLVELCTHKEIVVKGERIKKKMNIREAYTTRDSLARELYKKVFDYIISCINNNVNGDEQKDIILAKEIEIGNNTSINNILDNTYKIINILDMFGFEIFKYNSLNQLCINYANEKLQNDFCERIFKKKQEEYKREIDGYIHIDYTRNKLIEEIEKPCGLFDLIEEESTTPFGSSTSLLSKVQQYCKMIRVKSDRSILVEHYSNEVEYDITDFILKNRGISVSVLLQDCRRDVIMDIRNKVKEVVEDSDKKEYTFNNSTTTIISSFMKSIQDLFKRINTTQIKYIKCIKPNIHKENIFDEDTIRNQLSTCGILETIKIYKQISIYDMDKEEYIRIYGDTRFVKVGKSKVYYDGRVKDGIEGGRILRERRIQKIEKWIIRRIVKELGKKEYNSKERKDYKEVVNIREGKDMRCEEEYINNKEECTNINMDIKNIPPIETRNIDVTTNGKSESIKFINKEEISYNMQPNDIIPDNIQSTLKCNNCDTINLKYKFVCEALKHANLKIQKLESCIEDSLVYISNASTLYSEILCIYLEHIPIYNNNIPKSEMVSFAHLCAGITRKSNKDIREGINIFCEEINLRIKYIEKDINNIIYFISNLIEYKKILKIENRDLNDLINILYTHMVEEQKNYIMECIPYSVTDHQELKNFKCRDGFFNRFLFNKPDIWKLIKYLNLIYNKMTYYSLDKKYKIGSIRYLLKYIDSTVFNSIIVRTNKYLSFNRSIQINYNMNQIYKYLVDIDYTEGIEYLGHVMDIIKLVNINDIDDISKDKDVENIGKDKVIDNVCKYLNNTQIKELLMKMGYKVDCIKEDGYKYVDEPDLYIEEESVILGEVVNIEENFVFPRYIPSEDLSFVFN